MADMLRWTSADLEALPEDDRRYEIVDGELYVSKQPSWEHQLTCVRIAVALHRWSSTTGAGVVNVAPGVIFDEDDDIAPDVVWVSKGRLPTALSADRKLHAAPDLVVEVLSPGPRNERRDREVKLKLYSRRGVREYWIVDGQMRQVEVYRRQQIALELVGTLLESDVLESPLLPGFSVSVGELLGELPRA